jgi:hypothetical protein
MSSHGFPYSTSPTPPLIHTSSLPSSTDAQSIYGDDRSANVAEHSATFSGQYVTALSAQMGSWPAPIEDSRAMISSPANSFSSYSSLLHSPVEANRQTYTLAGALQPAMSPPSEPNTSSYPESSQRTAMEPASHPSDMHADSSVATAHESRAWSTAVYAPQGVGAQIMSGDHLGPPPSVAYSRNATARGHSPPTLASQNNMQSPLAMNEGPPPGQTHQGQSHQTYQVYTASVGSGNSGRAGDFSASRTTALDPSSYSRSDVHAAFASRRFQTPVSRTFQQTHAVAQGLGQAQGAGAVNGHSLSSYHIGMPPHTNPMHIRHRKLPARAMTWDSEGSSKTAGVSQYIFNPAFIV